MATGFGPPPKKPAAPPRTASDPFGLGTKAPKPGPSAPFGVSNPNVNIPPPAPKPAPPPAKPPAKAPASKPAAKKSGGGSKAKAPAAAPAPAPPPAEAQRDDQLASRWPAFSWALNIPELKAIFSDPNIRTEAELQAKIQGTPWWKGTEPARRNWQARLGTDPAGANQDKQQKEADVWDLYNRTGLKPNADEVRSIAEQALTQGWTDAQLTDAIVGHMQYSDDLNRQAGRVQAQALTFKQTARSWHVQMNDETYFNWAKQVAAGEKQETDFLPELQAQAKSRFSYSPEITAAIDRGVSPTQYFSPYQGAIAEELEVGADQIDFLSDPKWMTVMDFMDPDSKTRRNMTIAEAKVYARKQNEFQYTRAANEEAAKLTNGVLKMFGRVGA